MQTAISLTLLEGIGDYGSKIQNLPLTLGGYNLLALYLFKVMGQSGATLTLVNSNWDGVSNLFTTFLGYMMGERFNQRQYLGIGLITLGLFFI